MDWLSKIGLSRKRPKETNKENAGQEELKTARGNKLTEQEKLRLNQQISNLELEIKNKKAEAENMFITLHKEHGQNMSQAESELNNSKVYLDKQIERKENELKQLKTSAEQKKQKLKKEIDTEGQKFVEKRCALQKQKNESEQKNKDIELNTQEQIRFKDKEIIKLRQQMINKNHAWQTKSNKIQQTLDEEKNALNQKLQILQNQLISERNSKEKQIKEKEKQISDLPNQSEMQHKKLLSEFDEKKQDWQKINSTLKKQIFDLQEEFDHLQISSEQTNNQKLQELNTFKAKLVLQETKFKSEQEKKYIEQQKECDRLQKEINQLEQKITDQNEKFNSLFKQKEQDLRQYKNQAEAKEKQLKLQWNETESQLINQKEQLTQAVAEQEKKIRDNQTTWDKTRKKTEEQIEKLKLALTIKNIDIESAQAKFKHETKKIQQGLEIKFKKLKEKFDEQKQMWLSKISAKEEEIVTSKTRLANREERIKSEREKRQKELPTIISELQAEFNYLNKKHVPGQPAQKEKLKSSFNELKSLESQSNKLEKDWQEKISLASRQKDKMINELEQEIQQLGNQSIEELDRLARLYETKNKQIDLLSEDIFLKSEEIESERDYTQEAVSKLKSKKERNHG